MRIKLHTYPEGGASRMAQDEIVSKLTSRGRFTDCYVADLMDGDEYLLDPKMPLPSINAQQAIKYINDNQISIHPLTQKDPMPLTWQFRKNSQPFFTGEHGQSLMECLTHIIEMDEL